MTTSTSILEIIAVLNREEGVDVAFALGMILKVKSDMTMKDNG
jgi:hypothetical protein